MKKFFLLLVPILTILYSVDALLIDFHFQYDVFPVYIEETQPKMEVENFRIEYGNGLIQYIYKIKTILIHLNDPELSSEGELEKTKEKLEKILIGREISLFIYSFIVILAISSLFSLISNAWFSVFLSRFLYFFASLIAVLNLIRAFIHLNFIPNFAIPSIILNFLYLSISIYCQFIVKKYLLSRQITYNSLYIASQQSEESGTGKVSLPFTQKQEADISFGERFRNSFSGFFLHKLRIAYHFIIIILIGFVLGNLVYIPLFSLQKHYYREFGYLLGFSILLLSIFYIRNYYLIGREKENGSFVNLAVSASFLVYRFLRNLSLFLIIVLGITVFVIAFLFLLNYNISVLIEKNLIEKSVSL